MCAAFFNSPGLTENGRKPITQVGEKRATPDILWKELIRNFFADFTAFFKPELLPEIVVEKTGFLEKELISISGKQKKGIVDVLAKIFLKDGTIEYILFHIEIQRYRDKNFPVRMYNYFNKIWNIHQKPVLSLAILAYNVDAGKIVNVWEMHAFGTRLRYE